MNLEAKEVKMLKQLLQICFEDKIDMYLDDIKTFKSLRHRINCKNPLKNDKEKSSFKEKSSLEKEDSVEKKALKSNARKFWNRRNRHKKKQGLKKAYD